MNDTSLIDNNIAVLRAIKEGKTIQWKNASGTWRDYGSTSTRTSQGHVDFDSFQWRVKPEEKFFFRFFRAGGILVHQGEYSETVGFRLLKALNGIGLQKHFQPHTMKKYKEVIDG